MTISQTGGELIVGHSYLTSAGDLPPDTPVMTMRRVSCAAAARGACAGRRIVIAVPDFDRMGEREITAIFSSRQ